MDHVLHPDPYCREDLPIQALTFKDPHVVFDFHERNVKSSFTQHGIASYDASPVNVNSYQQQPRNNDAVFDFQARHNGTSNNIQSQSLMVRSTSTMNPVNDLIMRTNQQFAQQLDLATIQAQHQLMDNGFNVTADLSNLFLQSTKQIEEQNYESIIMTYLTFSHTSNLMARNVADSFKRSIISSLKLLDTSDICKRLNLAPPQQELVQFERRTTNIYGDYSQWEKILHILHFNEDEVREYLLTVDSDFGNDVPTIKFVISTLQHVGAETLSMTDTLRIYLITNIKAVSSLVAVKRFLGEAMHSTFNASDATNLFTACMADTRFTQDQFASDLAWFMQHVVVCPSFIEKCKFFIETQQNMLKWSQAEETKNHIGRVRLRNRIAYNSDNMNSANTSIDRGNYNENDGNDVTQNNMTSGAASQTSQLQQDSLQGWTSRARIPPAISHKSKLLGYLLMSQYTFADPSHALRLHFVNDSEIADNILAQRICKPHAAPIIEFLRLLSVHVTQFDELTAFRDLCFTDFSHTDSKDLSWLNFLQLYIAIYQHDDLWTIIWKSFCSILSHQVLISIGKFRHKYVYAVDKVVEICMRTEESGLKSIDEIFH